MEFIFELLAQFVFEFLFDGLGDGIDKLSRTKWGRSVLYVIFSLVPALGLGFLWGRHVWHTGQEVAPRSMWVSIAVAVALMIWATARRDMQPSGGIPRSLRFGYVRKLLLAFTNFIAAAGMAWGYFSAG